MEIEERPEASSVSLLGCEPPCRPGAIANI